MQNYFYDIRWPPLNVTTFIYACGKLRNKSYANELFIPELIFKDIIFEDKNQQTTKYDKNFQHAKSWYCM